MSSHFDPSPVPKSNIRTVPCKFWAKRSCLKGEACTFKHEPPVAESSRVPSRSANITGSPDASSPTTTPPKSRPTRLCAYYLTKSGCKYGHECTFIHSTSQTSDSCVAEKDPTTEKDRLPLAIENLKLLLKAFARNQTFNWIGRYEDFLRLSLIVLDSSDRNVQAKGVAILSEIENGGRLVIRYCAEGIGQTADPFRNLDFNKHIIPFVKIVTHDVFSKTCEEKNLLYIVKALYGADGERAARLLTRIIIMLNQMVQVTTTGDCKNDLQKDCLLVCELLYYILRYNADAVAQQDFKTLHESLRIISNDLRTTRSPIAGRIEKMLSEIDAYISPTPITAPKIIEEKVVELSTNVNHYDQLEVIIDLPGELSRTVPRHNNDSHRLVDIRILPTKDEFRSDRIAYLPINDQAAPHFLEGPARLFDIHFRLLREDMIGSMRTAVSVILSNLRPSEQISKALSQFNRRNATALAATRFYFDVRVDSVEFDRRKGLVFTLKFQQPPKFKGLDAKRRIQVWEYIRNLEKDALLCLVSNAPGVECFLTVSVKDKRKLGSAPDWCLLDVVVADGDETSQEYLLHMLAEDNRLVTDSMMLVEFPGVLLVAYKTILENIQNRSRHPYLPFSDVLCPRTDERQVYDHRHPIVEVRPPLYALSPGFEFDLAPLRSGAASNRPLMLPPNASPDDVDLLERLEAETTLDAGQCKGLIVGLTQELALVQGSSTSTSY